MVGDHPPPIEKGVYGMDEMILKAFEEFLKGNGYAGQIKASAKEVWNTQDNKLVWSVSLYGDGMIEHFDYVGNGHFEYINMEVTH